MTEEQIKSEKETIIDGVLGKLNSNDFKIYFYCPAMNTPSGGIGVLFKQAEILHDNGYNVVIVYEPLEDSKMSYQESLKQKKRISIYQPFTPTWYGESLKKLTFQCLGDGEIKFSDNTKEKCVPLTLNPEDFFIIPEGFPNIMERTATMPCKRIVFAQSWYYVLGSMNLGQKWQHHGIKDVISISDGITKYLNAVMPGLDIKNYSQAIDRNVFKRKDVTDKAPVIAYMPGRGPESQMKTINVIKTFYAFYPQYRWIRFDELKDLSREDFADRLSSASIALFTDEIAGFGTLPLEAMACGTHVVGWRPLGCQEYSTADNGFWGENGDIFQLAELLGYAVERLVGGQLDNPEIETSYENTLARYTTEGEAASIVNIYNTYKNERIEELNAIKQQ